ncbi:MAG TPA: methyltransferase domain-containing protein [Actinomycetota bacterium]|nr:methyltransferase domain-containing protein [Actinomycetota bacterium]
MLAELLEEGVVARTDSVIAVCAGSSERDLFVELGFTNVLITNLDERIDDEAVFAPFRWSLQDAQSLNVPDASFDFAFVADGLHHCSSPHRALLEMYRVSRKGLVVVESRDNLLMRVAASVGLTPDYELEAVVDNDFRWGGVDNTAIPNYIYRWTESEFRKTISSFDPSGKHTFRFFYGLNLPFEQAKFKRTNVKFYALRLSEPLVRAFTRVFKKQRNTLAMVALKPRVPQDLWPWLTTGPEGIEMDRAYAGTHFKTPDGVGERHP